MSRAREVRRKECLAMGELVFRDLHCLVVDDEPMILEDLQEMLKSLGVGHVTCARSGATALAKFAAAHRPVDFILCDLNMPDGNGLQLLKSIRTGRVRQSRLDACFIILTGAADRKSIEAAVSLDANGYLVKPITLGKLRQAIIRGRARHFPVSIPRYAQIYVPESNV
jgi:CheY-like chemotaxis protein